MRKIILVSMVITLLGCGAAKLKRLEKCEFKYSGITDVLISGQKLEDLKKDKNAGFMGAGILGKLLFANEVPITFNVVVKVTNPNKKLAALDKLEWTALLQDNEFLNGIYNQHFEVKPGETATLTIPISFDLKEKLMGENGATLKSFGMGYFLNGNVKGLTIRVRPYVGSVKFPKSFEIKPF